jgi:hypothetical protein
MCCEPPRVLRPCDGSDPCMLVAMSSHPCRILSIINFSKLSSLCLVWRVLCCANWAPALVRLCGWSRVGRPQETVTSTAPLNQYMASVLQISDSCCASGEAQNFDAGPGQHESVQGRLAGRERPLGRASLIEVLTLTFTFWLGSWTAGSVLGQVYWSGSSLWLPVASGACAYGQVRRNQRDVQGQRHQLHPDHSQLRREVHDLRADKQASHRLHTRTVEFPLLAYWDELAAAASAASMEVREPGATRGFRV